VVALMREQSVLVSHPDVLMPGTECDQDVEACYGRGPCPGRADLDVFDLLALELKAVEHGRTHDDGSAVLVVVEDGNRHALTQRFLDFETVRGADIFEVDAAEGRP